VAAAACAATGAGLARLLMAGLAALRLLAGLLRLPRALEGVVVRAAALRGLLAMRGLARPDAARDVADEVLALAGAAA